MHCPPFFEDSIYGDVSSDAHLQVCCGGARRVSIVLCHDEVSDFRRRYKERFELSQRHLSRCVIIITPCRRRVCMSIWRYVSAFEVTRAGG